MGHINSSFLDDSWLGAYTYDECVRNVNDTKLLMTKVGFVLNTEKSVLIPSKKVVFLGNIIDSDNMIVYLPLEKKQKIVHE